MYHMISKHWGTDHNITKLRLSKTIIDKYMFSSMQIACMNNIFKVFKIITKYILICEKKLRISLRNWQNSISHDGS